MRFVSQQDYNLFLHLNRELINTFIDVQIVIYKINVEESKKNIYGEATIKRWARGTQIPALVNRDMTTAVKDIQTVNTEQSVEFHLLREECKSRNIFPEIGDIINFDGAYYEINNTNEVQLVAGQSIYNHSITCTCHLTRNTNLQLEEPDR
jgi:hypothetical protein